MTDSTFGVKRVLRVYYTYIKGHEVPLIRLEGRWLRELGFTVDRHIRVEGKTGELTIKAQEPRAGEQVSGGIAPLAEKHTEYPPNNCCHSSPHRCRHCRRQLYFCGCTPEYLL